MLAVDGILPNIPRIQEWYTHINGILILINNYSPPQLGETSESDGNVEILTH